MSNPTPTIPTIANPTLTPKIVRAGQGQRFDLPGETRHLLLSFSDTGEMFSFSLAIYSQGAGCAPRAHLHEDRFFIVEAGQFGFEVGGEIADLKAGDFVFCPALAVCEFECTSQSGSLYIGATGAAEETFSAELADHFAAGEELRLSDIAVAYGIQYEEINSLPTSVSKPLIVRKNEASCMEAFGGIIWSLLPSQHTAHQFFIGASQSASLSGPPLHIHEREDETFVVRSGVIELQVDDARFQAGPGDVVFAPRNIPHTFRVVSSEPSTAYVISTPGGFDDFFAGAQRLFQSGEFSPATMVALGDEHGIKFLPPTA